MLDITFPPEPTRLHFYADSSSHDKNHQYVVVGGFLIRENRVGEVNNTVAELRRFKDGRSFSAFHYKDYRGGERKPNYFALIDYCYHLIAERQIHGYFITCDFRSFDHNKIEKGNPQKSVNKLYWQLILRKIALPNCSSCSVRVYPDQGGDSAEFVGFREKLCAKVYNLSRQKNNNYREALPNSIKEIKPTSSKKSGLIQMADVMASVIAAKRNQRTLLSAKKDLVEYALAQSVRQNWYESGNVVGHKLEIWDFQC